MQLNNNNLGQIPFLAKEMVPDDVVKSPIKEDSKLWEQIKFDDNSTKANKENESSPSLYNTIQDLVSKKLLKLTTVVSVIANLISAPVRLYDDDNPLKKIINHLSMITTKSHLLTYAVSGLNKAIYEKNPLLLFSFAVEGISAMFGIRKIYLFRGLASGVDGAVGSIQNKYELLGKQLKHDNFKDGLIEYAKEIKNVTKEFLADPFNTLIRSDGVHKGVMSSWFMIFGSMFGLGVNDSVGAGFRDIAGAVNDYSLIEYKSAKAKKSGAFYLSGSILDFAAHLFGMSESSKPFRNVFHEVAIALDRVGQYFFMRFLEESEESKKIENKVEPKIDLHKVQEKYLPDFSSVLAA